MTRFPLQPGLTLALLGLAACNPRGDYQGTLVDGLTGQPRANEVILARASNSSDMTCQVIEAKTDAAGLFTLAGTCPGDSYALKTKDDTLLLAGAPSFEGGTAGGPVAELAAWRAPVSSGVNLLVDDGLKPVKSRTRVMRDEKILETDTVAPYPESTFKQPTTVAAGQHLIISGKDTLARLHFVPLVSESERRTFVSGNSLTGHPFFGIDFTSDTEFTKVDAKLDESRIKQATSGDRVVRYIPAEALPPGQYALFGDGDAQALIIGFGDAPAPATAQAAAPAAAPTP